MDIRGLLEVTGLYISTVDLIVSIQYTYMHAYTLYQPFLFLL